MEDSKPPTEWWMQEKPVVGTSLGPELEMLNKFLWIQALRIASEEWAAWVWKSPEYLWKLKTGVNVIIQELHVMREE